MPPVLVVGTGRCGSTLLSKMIRLHPEALSVSELFSFASDLGMQIEDALPTKEISGADFWSILAEPRPRQSALLRHGLQMPEVIYPWDRGRFTPESGLPPIMQALIPHLDSRDPDKLFDTLAEVVPRWPLAPVQEHYRAFLNWLTRRFDRSFWVERSGGSLRSSRQLIQTFPDAKIIHLVRDGRDTALSMSQHIGFRMALLCSMQAQLLGVDPYQSDDRSEQDDLDDDLVDLLPESFCREAFDAFDLNPEICAHYWAGEIALGLETLAQVPDHSILTIRYEDLIGTPHDTVKKVDLFMRGVVDFDWVDRAANLVRKRPPRWTKLEEPVQKQLTTACEVGFDALHKHGIEVSSG